MSSIPLALSFVQSQNVFSIYSAITDDIEGCHVMEHESFESPDVASLLNDKFIPIKVDREAQQDIDEIICNM